MISRNGIQKGRVLLTRAIVEGIEQGEEGADDKDVRVLG
jgi:hypothetical protein